MHIETIGQGSPVIFFHGSSSPPELLEPIGKALSTLRTVHFVHAPGYGRSPVLPRGAARPSLTAIQMAMEQALLDRGITEAAFVGYSLGAYHAMALALRGHVKATRVVCLAGLANLSEADRAARLAALPILRSDFDLRPMMLQTMVSAGFAQRHPECAHQVVRWLDATSRENMADECEAAAYCDNLLPALHGLASPLLARVGELDAVAPPEGSREIVRAVPHGSLEIVPEVGHALPLEDLDGTILSVRRFLLHDDPA